MKTKFSQPSGDDPMVQLNLQEIAEDLVAELNHYAMATEDLPDMTGPELAMQLDKMLRTDTIEFFLSSGDYGRGLLGGIGIAIFALELAVDNKLALATEAVGGDEDDVDEDEIEKIILAGLKNGLHGGGPGDDESIN